MENSNYLVRLFNNHSNSEHYIQDGSGFAFSYTNRDDAEKAGQKHIGKYWKRYDIVKAL